MAGSYENEEAKAKALIEQAKKLIGKPLNERMALLNQFDAMERDTPYPGVAEMLYEARQRLEYNMPFGGRRKLRLNVKRRGTKRHGRSGKHRKLRKLSTRRR
jgi:hypothetical protein